MARPMLKFVPQWDGMIEQTAWKLAWAHEWRTMPLWDVDDLVQEGRIIFQRLVDRYWPEVRSRSHFNALFYRSLSNKINNLAKQTSRKRVHVAGSMDNEGLEAVAGPKADPSLAEAEVRMLLEDLQGYEPLDRLVRQLVLSDMKPRHVMKGQPKSGRYRARETRVEFLRRVAHVDEGFDIVGAIRTWIQGELCPTVSTSPSTSTSLTT